MDYGVDILEKNDFYINDSAFLVRVQIDDYSKIKIPYGAKNSIDNEILKEIVNSYLHIKVLIKEKELELQL